MPNYLQYYDYLLNVVIDKDKTYHSFTDPSLSINRIDKMLDFRSDLSKDRIYQQADHFSKRFTGYLDPNVRVGQILTDRNLDRVRQKLRDAYLYSAFKAVFYYNLYESSGVSSLQMFDAGYMFSGHLALLELLCRNYTSSHDQVECAILRKRLTGIGSDAMSSIMSDELYKTFLDGSTFYSYECERTLQEIDISYSYMVYTCKVSDGYPISGDSSPLGNLCVDSTGDFLFTTGYGSRNDIRSLYWNSAVGITVTGGDDVANSQSYYMNCGSVRHGHITAWEVEAITGLKGNFSIYPFEHTGTPGNDPDSPDFGGPSKRKENNDGGSNNNSDSGRPKPIKNNPNGNGNGRSNPRRPLIGRRQDNSLNIRVSSNGSNEVVGRSLQRRLFDKFVDIATNPVYAEKLLDILTSHNEYQISREHRRAIMAEAKAQHGTVSRYRSHEFGIADLRYKTESGNSVGFSKSEGGFR